MIVHFYNAAFDDAACGLPKKPNTAISTDTKLVNCGGCRRTVAWAVAVHKKHLAEKAAT